MTEGVGADAFRQSPFTGRYLDGFVDDTGIDMMAAHGVTAWVRSASTRGKNVLPAPFTACPRILASQGIGQIHLAVSLCQILFVDQADFRQMLFETGTLIFFGARTALIG